ncbi:MAG: F0F1 ATP synthase subunit alpha, partial [Gammaproteobacteria bacterium PRO9]|nr:F0F1 ATP synthase subunit alpha [Gammaproteobacteria bacterium PRO9]
AKSVVAYEAALHAHAQSKFGQVIADISAKGDYNDAIAGQLKQICEDFKQNGAY